MSILDRYVIRQVLAPFVLGLLVFTFMLIIPGLMREAETFIAKGASFAVVAEVMWTLVPGAFALTIPMSLLLALLVAFGRLSADREFVAMQACGVSLARLLRPVSLFALVSAGATAYMWMVAMPAGNQRFQDITFAVTASLAEGAVEPRVFFDQFPDLVLYVRDVPRRGGWEGVFLADNRPGVTPTVNLARRGRVDINRDEQTVHLVLEDATAHSGDGKDYVVSPSKRSLIVLDPARVFPTGGGLKSDREMSIPELKAKAADLQSRGTFPHNQLFEIQTKYAIPVSCLVFGLIGLALGATNRRDGSSASFVIGVVVIFLYFVFLEGGRALNKGHVVPPAVAAWMANVLLGTLGLMLLLLRRRVADQPLRMPIPAFVRAFGARWRTLGQGWLPLSILDRYVASTYARVLGLSMLALGSVFYISLFIDQSEKVFKGAVSWSTFGAFVWYQTPQYVYYIIPLSILLATLVTVALLTKSSELVVIKACGVSLYRVTVPMLAGAVVGGLTLFALEETVLGPANKKTEHYRLILKGASPETLEMSTRRWVVGDDGDIYHFNYFDPRTDRFIGLSVFEFTPDMGRITRRTFAQNVVAVASTSEPDSAWRLEAGWTREFDEKGKLTTYTPFESVARTLAPLALFKSDPPIPEFMSYSQLRSYLERIGGSGFGVVAQQVALARKLAFPFVTLIMTLIAVPFAVTIGRGGAMAGIGLGIAIAIVYWVTISVFGALGAGGAMPPQLAAWAPNVLFGAGAVYLLMTVRT